MVYLNLLDLKTLQGLWLSSNPAVKPYSVLLPFEFAILLLFCVVVFYHLPFNQNVARLQGCRVGLRDLRESRRSWRDHGGSNPTTQHLSNVFNTSTKNKNIT